ncbi:MAG: CPBP family intramembrane metalloprotease [Chloroflexi bacterium AL-W]|nr:CPBP family intramembrane metalloprotease [Chloroflexi bacterium AL-N1]NOK66435.1 CPBP family intramembrane metalloprotease [Chloroflexi bacterium AL-N10]NOK71823.1 CPBP family intramembrane metalloprotease [Chloroflexi bacterium AL-N5]NOK81080.1 CPBP family intramembrane metalloprotease [Chloroflexi bacterium AL-W]NOK89353.1 CPBP family intramembrane metalloprotease [Chloroflexi bacterium AL-N15]
MSNISSGHSQELGTTPATASTRPNQLARPGWPEIIVGLVVLGAVTIATVLIAGQLGLGPVVFGLILTALAGVGGIAGFAAAVLLRIRSWSVFGVRRTTRRWLLIGVGAGVVAFVLKALAIQVWILITGDSTSPQGVYGDGGSGGVLSLILATLFLSLLTPLGEELLFRGVITNALLRYGPLIGIVGSTLIFALAHGINIVFPAALVMGLVGAELLRRSGSVWPGVVAHAVVNLPTVPALVLAGAA